VQFCWAAHPIFQLSLPVEPETSHSCCSMLDHHLLTWPPCCPAAAAVLPAFIQSNSNKKRTVRCINPKQPLVTLLLPLKNSGLPFLNAGSYVGASLRLNGASSEIPLTLAIAARCCFLRRPLC